MVDGFVIDVQGIAEMTRPKNSQKSTPEKVQTRDLFRTPRYATELLLPYLKTKYIWECACGEDHITNVLDRNGFKVVHTDIRSKPPANINFLDPLSHWVMGGVENDYTIVTNPPYSSKQQFYKRCIELDVPFALLIPADYSGWLIEAVKDYKCEKLVPTRRIDYITPTGLSGDTGHTSYFHSLWLTRYMNLGAPEVYVELTNEDKKRIY